MQENACKSEDRKPSSEVSFMVMSATQMELLFLFDGNIIPNITAKFDNCISSGFIMTADNIEGNSQYRPYPTKMSK